MRKLVLTLAAVLSTAICSPAFAAFTYSLETADASNVAGTLGNSAYDFTSTAGGTLNLYLVQRGMAASTVAAQSVTFQFNRNAGDITTQTPTAGSLGYQVQNATTGTVPPTIFQFNNADIFGPGVNSSAIAGTSDGFGNPLQGWAVGSMTFAGPAGQNATYNFASLGGNTINVDGANITGSTDYGGNISVTVPEPSSIAALGLVSAFVLGRRRRMA